MKQGISLFSDPLYGFIEYTTPMIGETDATEETLIDTPWMQRLRRISQIQSARWVFPTGEHSRFTHSLGTMHNAGLFAAALYPSLQQVATDLPSREYIIALCRIAGLLHDIGHGPFSHFFDDAYLKKFNLNHEILGQKIIVHKLGPIIASIKRSPYGAFRERKRLQPEDVAFLIRKEAKEDPARTIPHWLALLKPLFSGAFTVDNTDYVNRDAYMCGIKVGPVDIDRIRHYSFYMKEGLVVHRKGAAALNMFLLARWYLYANIYFHRTVRSIDLQMKEIFAPTLAYIIDGNPLRKLSSFLELDEWNLFTHVKQWKAESGEKKRLARNWEKIFQRKLKWKVAFERSFSLSEIEKIGWLNLLTEGDLEREVKKRASLKVPFKVDLASMDPRPLNPLKGKQRILIYDDQLEKISAELTQDYLRNIPIRLVQFRVLTTSFTLRKEISKVITKIFSEQSFTTSL